MVYSETINDIQQLKQQIRAAITAVTLDVLGHVWQEVEYRLDVCRATNGVHTLNFTKHTGKTLTDALSLSACFVFLLSLVATTHPFVTPP
jgi:hypothetical protein